MTIEYTRRFRVRHYELDVNGHIHDVTLVRYMQEAAIEASTSLGFSPAWYQEQGVGWVVRRLSVRYLLPVTYGDEIEIRTWISGLRGVRSTREYDLGRTRDGARVARGRAEWVYVEARTGQPTRVPDGWAEALPKLREVEDLGARLGNARPTEAAHRYVSSRRVQAHEIDVARHVNHAVYLSWAGQAYHDALRAAGYPPERTREEGWMVLPAGHEVQYFAPALDNDNVEVVSWLCDLAEGRAAWTHEVSSADSRKLLARVYSAGAFVNPEGAPIAAPGRGIEDILRGPAQ